MASLLSVTDEMLYRLYDHLTTTTAFASALYPRTDGPMIIQHDYKLFTDADTPNRRLTLSAACLLSNSPTYMHSIARAIWVSPPPGPIDSYDSLITLVRYTI